MTRLRRAVIVICALVMLAWLAGCGDDDGAADDGPAPRASGEVDIDGGTVRYRSEDGDAVFELDDAGKVRVTDDDGETVLTHGDGTVLPEQWPESLALPDGLTLTSASTMDIAGELRVNATGELRGEPRAVHEDLMHRLEAAGFDVQGESFQDDDGVVFATISATDGRNQAAVTVTGTGESLVISVFLGLGS